jgi:hypothetical protein
MKSIFSFVCVIAVLSMVSNGVISLDGLARWATDLTVDVLTPDERQPPPQTPFTPKATGG